MSISLTNESKNNVSLTLENKVTTPLPTWDEATFKWDDATSFTWDTGGTLPLEKELKNNVSLTLENKN